MVQEVQTDDETWPDLERWLDRSERLHAAIERKELRSPAFDSWNIRDAWEADRSLLVWALRMTPASTIPALQVKARAIQANGRFHTADLTDRVIGDLIAMTEPQAVL